MFFISSLLLHKEHFHGLKGNGEAISEVNVLSEGISLPSVCSHLGPGNSASFLEAKFCLGSFGLHWVMIFGHGKGWILFLQLEIHFNSS